MSDHECDAGHFDRTICPEPCGMMHSFCSTCGARADICAHEGMSRTEDVGLTETRVIATVERIVADRVREAEERAWDEGHRTQRRLGPDGCERFAWSESECACGLYGSNVITPNPYRADRLAGDER